jgi:uridylate kinase
VAKRRVLLKISGEALAPKGEKGLGHDQLAYVTNEVKAVLEKDAIDIALVVGGGNFLRGREVSGERVRRVTADHMGMLATIINGLAMQASLESAGVETRVLSAIDVADVAEPFIVRRAVRHMEKGRVVIFVGGTGNPFFSTDSAAALRANEIGADVLLKGTNVRGVYAEDPRQNSNAEFFEEVTFDKVLRLNLKVMDAAAFALCRDNNLTVRVFDMTEAGNIQRALDGEALGSLVTN